MDMSAVCRRVMVLWGIFSVFCLLFPAVVEGKAIINLKPTISAAGVRHTLLKKVGELSVDGHYKNFFLLRPADMAVGPQGELFIYDADNPTILQLDKNLQVACKIGRGGFGPGEMFSLDKSGYKLYLAPDNTLLVSDTRNVKIIQFDFSGNLIREIPLDQRLSQHHFFPVMDREGNVYTPSVSGGVVDKWSPKGERLKTYFNETAIRDFLLHEPPFSIKWRGRDFRMKWDMAGAWNTWCDVFAGGHLVIYLANSATLCVFKDDIPVMTKPVWIEEELPFFKVETEMAIQMNKDAGKQSSARTWQLLYNGVIRKDHDDNVTYYLQGKSEDANRCVLYRFDLQGKLREVFYSEESFSLFYKRHNRFYGYKNGLLKIFEAEANHQINP